MEQSKVEKHQLYLSEVLPLLSSETLVSLLKDIYHAEPGPDWAAIDGYRETSKELRSRGYTISVERVGPEDHEVIVSPNDRIPY